jgi:hypothetical protein
MVGNCGGFGGAGGLGGDGGFGGRDGLGGIVVSGRGRLGMKGLLVLRRLPSPFWYLPW